MRRTTLAWLLGAVMGAALTQATPAEAPEPYLRVETADQTMRLQIASRRFEPRGGEGPTIDLVGVAHIADPSFYEELQEALDAYGLVLYESVMPPGAGGAGGDTADARIDSTHAAMGFVDAVLRHYRQTHERYPNNLLILHEYATGLSTRLGSWLAAAAQDAWGHGVRYEPAANGRSFTLTSYGADAAPGGTDEAADLVRRDDDPATFDLAAREADSLQADLAHALDLAFQLDAIDYSALNWRCSDMAVDELERRFAARGLDFEAFGGTLAGSSLSGQIARALLRIIPMLDAMAGGGVTDLIKIMLIEMLGDEELIHGAMAQFGADFTDIIINQRNDVVIDDLADVLASDPQAESIAVFYGAGHMRDLESRLVDELGYTPVEDGTTWRAAISVNLKESPLTPLQIAQMRRMVRQAMQQQMRAPERN